MGFFAPPTPPPLPAVPTPSAPPPLFGAQQTPAAKKPGAKPFNPTFLGSAMTPQPNQLGAKTLLGQ